MTSVVVYSCFTCLLSARLFMLLLFSCLFIMLFSYLMSAVILVIILCTLFICTSSPLYTHTHQVAFWRPWICTSRYWTLYFYCQVFDETIHIVRSLSLSLSDSGILIFLIFLLFHYSRYIRSSCYSISSFIWYHAWMLICIIAVVVDSL